MKKILIYAQIKSYFFVCSILLMMSLIKKPSDRSNPREEQQKKDKTSEQFISITETNLSFSIYYVYQKNRQNPFIEVLISSKTASWISQTLLQKTFFTIVVKIFRKLSLVIFLNIEFRIWFKITSKNDFSTKKALFKFYIAIILWILFTWFICWKENYHTVL